MCPIHGDDDVGTRWSKDDGYHWRCEVGGISEEDTGWTCVHQDLGPASKDDYEAQWGEVAIYRPGDTGRDKAVKIARERCTWVAEEDCTDEELCIECEETVEQILTLVGGQHG